VLPFAACGFRSPFLSVKAVDGATVVALAARSREYQRAELAVLLLRVACFVRQNRYRSRYHRHCRVAVVGTTAEPPH
jgi:hypothetical protein